MDRISSADKQHDFHEIIKKVGNKGPFQRRHNILYIFLFSFTLAMSHLNIIISLAVPDHWCHVPGREYTNYTIGEWKFLTIPQEVKTSGILDYSKCRRFENISYSDIAMRTESTKKCDHGWDFDHTWFSLTASIQNEWVCDNSMIPTNSLAISRLGEVEGSLIFSHLADNFGRMPVIFATIVTLVIGRIMSILTSSWVYLFFLASFIGTLPIATAFYCPSVIAIEISRPSDRAFIRILGTFGWALGLIIAPLLMWIIQDWTYFTLATTLPCGLFLVSYQWLIESPRWLASRGKVKRCIKQLQKIAQINKNEMPKNLEEQLTNVFKKQEDGTRLQTFLSLFSSWRLAKNATILIYCYSALHVIFVCLAINVNHLAVNPFLQYVYQALAALPGYVIAKLICDRFGRRIVTIFGFLICMTGSIIAVLLVKDDNIVSIISICLKFCVSVVYFSLSVQIMEMYPTCIRQIGISVGCVLGNFFSILSPYIIAMGVSINPIIPYIIYASLSLISAISCVFLPETLNHQLPETLKDASIFGADQNLWGWAKPSRRRMEFI